VIFHGEDLANPPESPFVKGGDYSSLFVKGGGEGFNKAIF
jgi:hypothetical protein